MKLFRFLLALCGVVALAAGLALADKHGAKGKSDQPAAACCASEAKAEKKAAGGDAKATCGEKSADKDCAEKACGEKDCDAVAACCASGDKADQVCAMDCCVDAKVACKDCGKCSPEKAKAPAKKA